jgi:hypothetical protein
MILAVLLVGCQHQYLAIPGATPVLNDDLDLHSTDQVFPAWTIADGDVPDQVDESVTIDVPLDGAWSFEVTDLVFTVWLAETVSYGEYWVYELQEEERAAGVATITIQILSRKPTKEACSKWHVGTKVCFGRVDQGITTTSFFLTDLDGNGSYGAEVPITLPPLRDGGDAPGECLDVDFGTPCCTASGGIRPTECRLDPSCGCPSGTVDVGTDERGFLVCECPQ